MPNNITYDVGIVCHHFSYISPQLGFPPWNYQPSTSITTNKYLFLILFQVGGKTQHISQYRQDRLLVAVEITVRNNHICVIYYVVPEIQYFMKNMQQFFEIWHIFSKSHSWYILWFWIMIWMSKTFLKHNYSILEAFYATFHLHQLKHVTK